MISQLPLIHTTEKNYLNLNNYLCSIHYCKRRKVVNFLNQLILHKENVIPAFVECSIPPRQSIQTAVEKHHAFYYAMGKNGLNVSRNIFELDNYSDSRVFVYGYI